MNDRQLGKIKITENFIRTAPDGVALTLALLNFIPVKAENYFNSYNNYFEYIGISSYFEELPEGVIIPEYVINMQRKGEEIIIESVNKVENVGRFDIDTVLDKINKDFKESDEGEK